MRVVLREPTPRNPSHSLDLELDNGHCLPLIDGKTGKVADLTAEIARAYLIGQDPALIYRICKSMTSEPHGRARMKG